jgi:DNA-binding CsgD family transcriptional regulator
MIPEEQRLSELVSAIYDTVLDRSLWPAVMKMSAEFVGGSAASVYSKNSATGRGSVYYKYGVEPYYEHLYFSKLVRQDPTTAGHCLANIGQVVALGDIVLRREYEESRFHEEWAKPQGLVDCLSSPLDKSAGGTALFGVFRHKDNGVIDDLARRRGAAITSHIRRAVLIGNVLEKKTTETAAFMQSLNGLATAVFLVEKNCRIVFANESGQAMLEDGRVLCVRNDALATADSRPALSDVIAFASGGDAALGARGIALPLCAPSETPWLAHVLPLTSSARQDTGTNFGAVAAVFVHRTTIETLSSIESVSKLYGLTPGEMRVLSAVSDIGGISAVADAIGISQATVKTHLQRLFAKTGTNRQADLIKLVATHAGPLRQP